MSRTGFRPMGISKNVPHWKRIWLIRHLIGQGITDVGLKEMNASEAEIKEAREVNF